MTCIVSEGGMLPVRAFNPLSHFNPGNLVAVGTDSPFTISPNSSCQRNYWAHNGKVCSSSFNSNPLEHKATEDALVKLFALQKDKFPVNFSAGPNGEVAAFIDTTGNRFTPAFLEITSGEQIATESQVILLAKPSEGYHLIGWTLAGDTIGKGNPLVYKVTNGDNKIIAHFAVGTDTESFPVHFSASKGGKITAQSSIYQPSYMKVPLKDGYPIKKGTSVSFTAVPDTLHLVKTWSVNGVIQERSNGYKSFSHYFSREDTVKVEFEQFVARFVKFEASPAEGGDVTVMNHELKNISSGDVVPDGSKITVYTQNKDGYVFDYWEIDGVPSDEKKEPNIFDYKVTKDVSFKAFFRQLVQKPVTFEANGAGSVEGEMSGTKIKSGKSIQEGTYLRFIATADNGAEFRNWTINGVDTLAGRTTILYKVLKDKDNTIVANFESKPVAEYTVTFVADPKEGGTVTATHNDRDKGKEVPFETGAKFSGDEIYLTFKAKANDGYKIVSWIANGKDVTPSNPEELKYDLKADLDLKVVFKKLYQLTLTPTMGGNLEAKVGDKVVKSGEMVLEDTKVTIEATPDTGYELTALTAGTEDILATKSFVMNGATEVKATFTKLQKNYKVTLKPTEHGTISIKEKEKYDLNAVPEGTKLTVVAKGANDKCELTKLTANGEDILKDMTFTVTKDTEVVAEFVDRTGIDAVAANAFVIYPNPASESATVTGLAPEAAVALYTLDGQLITRLAADRSGRLQIDLTALSEGTYLVVTEGIAQRLIVKH